MSAHRVASVALGLLLFASAASAEPRGLPPGVTPIIRGGITPISEINANLANGKNALEESFTQVTIRGVAQSRLGALDPFDAAAPSTWFYVADGTGTVAIANRSVNTPAVAVGDSVEVTTFVFTQPQAPLRGTRTLDISYLFSGTITVLASGATPTAPVAIAPTDVTTNGAAYEGSLVTVSGVSVVSPAEWPAPGASAFVRVTDGSTEFRIRVDEDTDLDEIIPPSGSFDVTGFVAQDAPSPYAAGHFVYPRGRSDVRLGDGSGSAVVAPTVVSVGTTGQELAFTVTGDTAELEQVRLGLPASWTWDTPGDVVLSGAGFASASAAFAPSGGGWLVTVTGATVTDTAPGTMTVGSLTTPALVETSPFPVETAVSGGTPSLVTGSPTVLVVTPVLPGDVLVNEVYPQTTQLAQGIERSEFVELYNRTAADIPLEGWTLTDIGRTSGCERGARWAFPPGALIPAGGYVVVCQTAFDSANSAGFRVMFPSLPGGVVLYEMFDPGFEQASADDPTVANLVLLDPTPGNDQIILLGGPSTNVGQCLDPSDPNGPRVPFAEEVVLWSAEGNAIDVLEYRYPGPCDGDFCDGLTGADDAYAFGPPKAFHTLGRDASSTDTDDSSADLRPSSTPTPGAGNQPGDTVPPLLAIPTGNVFLGRSILELAFDEALDPVTARDPASYAITGPGGETYDVTDVLPDPSSPFQRFFLVTDTLPRGSSLVFAATGLTDVPFDGAAGNSADTTFTISVPAGARTVCEVQEFDEVGRSPLVGELVRFAGFVTIPPSSEDRLSIWVQEPGEGGCGVNVFSFDLDLPDIVARGVQLNDLVIIEGQVTEFVSASSGSGSVTEVEGTSGAELYEFVARGLPGPAPRVVTTNGCNDEALEGSLVRTTGTAINANDLAVWIDDGSGATQIFQNFSSLDLTRYKVGDHVQVTGIITQFDSSEPYLDGYELVPQNQEAIVLLEGNFAPADVPTLNVQTGVLVPSMGEKIGIEVRVPRRSDVIVEIFDIVGRKVTTLYDGVGLADMNFEWDGMAQNGSVVEPGAYICHVRTVPLDGGNVETHSAPIVVGLRLD